MAIIDVVRNTGERGSMAWKHPSEELGSWSQLLVNEGEEAVIFAAGRSADRFAAGCHTLKTANIPLLRSLVRVPFGGKSPFTAELWFVNVSETLDIKWGTDEPILISGSGEQPPSLMRGYGLFGVRVANAELFVSSLRGRVDSFDKRSLSGYLRGQLSELVRESIATCMRRFGSDFLARTDVSKLLAAQLRCTAAPIAAQYGIEPSCLIISDLCVAPQAGSDETRLTFSAVSVVIPPTAALQPVTTSDPMPAVNRRAIVVAASILLLLLLLVFCLLLPPRQTADFVGIASVALAHCLVTAVVVWLLAARRGLLVTVGFGATVALYWLGAVGTALVFRLLSATGTVLLLVLELGMVGVAALALMGFWYGRVYDRAQEVAADEAED